MSHYFTDNQNLPHNRKEFSFRFLSVTYSFVTDSGIFSKDGVDQGTEILLQCAANQPLAGSVLDLGCGLGVISVICKTMFPQIEMIGIDVNTRAVDYARLNCARNHVDCSIMKSEESRIGVSELDWVIANPPIRVGKAILYTLFEEVFNALNKGGHFMFVIRKSHGAQSAKIKCESLFGNCSIIERSKGYYILLCEKH